MDDQQARETDHEGAPTMNESIALTAEDFTVLMEPGVDPFPFFEDEDANGLWGYGHHDKTAFASEVNRYDEYVGGGDPEFPVTEAEVQHVYYRASVVTEGSEDWRIDVVPAETPGSFPGTCVTR